MMILKNNVTGEIAEFQNPQEGWVKASDAESSSFLNEKEMAKLKRNLLNSRINYLRSTDWYIAREIDEPNSYPEEVKNKRILARQEINEIGVIDNLAELENYEINF